MKIIVPENAKVNVILPDGYLTDNGSGFFADGGETEFFCIKQTVETV